jgi:hypothetical protein
VATDNFTRADEDPLAFPWTQWYTFNRLVLASNLLAPITTLTVQGAYRTDSATGLSSMTTYDGADGGPGIHLDSSGNGYIGRGDPSGDYRIYRVDAGAFTQIAATGAGGAAAPTTGDVQTLERSGGTVYLKLNGATITSASSSTYTGGNDGVFVYQDMRFSLWQSGGGADTLMGQIVC